MSKSDDLVFDAKAKFKSTVGSVSGIFENKNKDIIKAIEQGAKSGKIKFLWIWNQTLLKLKLQKRSRQNQSRPQLIKT